MRRMDGRQRGADKLRDNLDDRVIDSAAGRQPAMKLGVLGAPEDLSPPGTGNRRRVEGEIGALRRESGSPRDAGATETSYCAVKDGCRPPARRCSWAR